MKRLLSLFVLLLLLPIAYLLLPTTKAYAIEDPLAHPNNKFGIHILFPSELEQASHLINSKGGDWGYVIIPIQAGDKDLQKWQNFMDTCRSLHIIPILRLATENYYFNTTVWRKPTDADVMDFANFLNSLDWPTKNRYIVVFNEVNRGDEWGGSPDASDYAQILSYAVTVFKERSPDFFVISAGLDNAAPSNSLYVNEYDYISQMNAAVPGIFNQIDGIASHSYPNPGFVQAPWVNTRMSIDSFSYEKALIDSFSAKSLPVFITETGWSQDTLGQQTVASYFTQAFTTVWNDQRIVAVLPFLLEAGSGPFEQFSLLTPGGAPNPVYTAIQNLSKTKGQPSLNQTVLAAQISPIPEPSKRFDKVDTQNKKELAFAIQFKNVLKWLLELP